MKNAPIILILSISLFYSCEKEPILTPTTPPIVEKDSATDRAVPFEFTILKTPCLLDKVNVSVDIETPNLYDFLWQVDGNKEGHLQELEGCQCSDAATVTVTRLRDGARIKRSIALPSCSAPLSTNSTVAPNKELGSAAILTPIK